MYGAGTGGLREHARMNILGQLKIKTEISLLTTGSVEISRSVIRVSCCMGEKFCGMR